MDVSEIIQQLSHHYQMAAAWDHFAKQTTEASEDPMHHIPIDGGLTPTRVGSKCLDELREYMQEQAQGHREKIASLTAMQASPIQLAETPPEPARVLEEVPEPEEGAATEEPAAVTPIRRQARRGGQEQ
jgi:hypothetical protein